MGKTVYKWIHWWGEVNLAPIMFKEILALCLVAHVATAIPQWNYWTYHQPLVYQPLAHTQPMPVYSFQHFKSAITGHMGPQKVTTYNKVLPYAIDFDDPRFFIEFCEDNFRYFGIGFDLMDLNKDGKVSYSEVSHFTDDEGEWQNFVYKTATNLNIKHAYESDDLTVLYAKVGSLAASRFNEYDKNNDNVLDMAEFFDYLAMVYDAVAFYTRALRDLDGDNDLIEQKEWDCTYYQIDHDECDVDAYEQTLISGMIGNDGDSVLTFDEFRNVMKFYKQVAKQFERLEIFCQNADEVDEYPSRV